MGIIVLLKNLIEIEAVDAKHNFLSCMFQAQENSRW